MSDQITAITRGKDAMREFDETVCDTRVSAALTVDHAPVVSLEITHPDGYTVSLDMPAAGAKQLAASLMLAAEGAEKASAAHRKAAPLAFVRGGRA